MEKGDVAAAIVVNNKNKDTTDKMWNGNFQLTIFCYLTENVNLKVQMIKWRVKLETQLSATSSPAPSPQSNYKSMKWNCRHFTCGKYTKNVFLSLLSL